MDRVRFRVGIRKEDVSRQQYCPADIDDGPRVLWRSVDDVWGLV